MYCHQQARNCPLSYVTTDHIGTNNTSIHNIIRIFNYLMDNKPDSMMYTQHSVLGIIRQPIVGNDIWYHHAKMRSAAHINNSYETCKTVTSSDNLSSKLPTLILNNISAQAIVIITPHLVLSSMNIKFNHNIKLVENNSLPKQLCTEST